MAGEHYYDFLTMKHLWLSILQYIYFCLSLRKKVAKKGIYSSFFSGFCFYADSSYSLLYRKRASRFAPTEAQAPSARSHGCRCRTQDR